MLKRTILGVSYLSGPAHLVVEAGLSAGFVVIPSAPVIVRMWEDGAHREALTNADLAIPDSGLMVLGWRVLTGERLVRVSGLEYLKLLLARPELRQPGALAWIMPSAPARDRNIAWLQTAGHATRSEDCYLAPIYPPAGALSDARLLEWIREREPRHVIIALGGGVQERLGWFLRQNLGSQPGIHGVGAAIGFLSGEQVNIPPWADRYFLGWFCRCWCQPARFIPRYLKAARLIGLLWRYREELPPLKTR